MKATPVEKDEVANELKSMRELFTKSVVARIDLKSGDGVAGRTFDAQETCQGTSSRAYA